MRFNEVLYVLLILVLLFIFVTSGTMKLTEKFHEETHELLTNMFEKQFTPVWQRVVGDKIGIQIDSNLFQTIIGGLELASGVLLVTPIYFVGGVVLGAIMIGAILTHVWAGEPAGFQALLLVACMASVLLRPSDQARKSKSK
uniref:DoxX family protein n=1 Tax=Fibrocapsa japonica TaxID=94617 RepID=A0A6U1PSD7_9STRA|mmetsp:Transcript_5908/g.8941  ORF Transcript_5908/g.8941 Transcript_5908/m.8941 type:complete len:142 (+) Transcript_5908:120-545(+)|eukprot:CAMPEP_0113935428 /NCGR_PEP_ID=MMETSP1339-20121228/2580_1 /TAXON_ID=94617 /ORGANISM="Fibrocapsa japonica" /LENGTH=141 /DNA_ID=CAMNT_0000937575 /DNA_START=111 /DNA_END=536 /DNA_ORIENTATION=+ /assembly_acc=CAM_ASM_000762